MARPARCSGRYVDAHVIGGPGNSVRWPRAAVARTSRSFQCHAAADKQSQFISTAAQAWARPRLLAIFSISCATQAPEVVILEGRCYERESVPYKALDGVVDSFTKYLLSLPEAKAEALMPREVLALARLFPVMLQVDSVFNAPQREQEIPDPFSLRRKAFAALRELLGRICDRQPLVLYIDDLQWSDADSTTLLEDLLRPPDSPPLLLLSSFRSEDVRTKPFLKALLEKTGNQSCREVLVGALSKSESYTLLHDLLGSSASVLEPFADAILGEARGNPFLLEQLARYALSSDQTATTGITLAVMLDERLRHLPKGARQFIDALAVAGRPINPEVAYQAAELSGDELPLVTTLRAAQFLRTGGAVTRSSCITIAFAKLSPANSHRKELRKFTAGWPRQSKPAASTILKHSSNTTWARAKECAPPLMPPSPPGKQRARWLLIERRLFTAARWNLLRPAMLNS